MTGARRKGRSGKKHVTLPESAKILSRKFIIKGCERAESMVEFENDPQNY
jgi:hypothetical protein